MNRFVKYRICEGLRDIRENEVHLNLITLKIVPEYIEFLAGSPVDLLEKYTKKNMIRERVWAWTKHMITYGDLFLKVGDEVEVLPNDKTYKICATKNDIISYQSGVDEIDYSGLVRGDSKAHIAPDIVSHWHIKNAPVSVYGDSFLEMIDPPELDSVRELIYYRMEEVYFKYLRQVIPHYCCYSVLDRKGFV